MHNSHLWTIHRDALFAALLILLAPPEAWLLVRPAQQPADR